MRALRGTAIVIGVIQLVLGVVFIFIPVQFATIFGLDATPDWVNWIFAMFGARAIGYAVGMLIAVRQPERHAAWLLTMIGIQAVDWVATLVYLTRGTIRFSQVPTAVILPVLFILITGLWWLRQRRTPAPAVS